MFYHSSPADADDDVEYRDEKEGSIITSLISQLRCVCFTCDGVAAEARMLRASGGALVMVMSFVSQGRDGPLEGHVPHLRARAA